MPRLFFSIARLIVFQLICATLIFGVVAYRTDVINAQNAPNEEETPIALPRSTQSADDEDDDEDGDDPPTDNDGIDTPLEEDAETVADPVYTYTIRLGDTLLRVARRLGVPYSILRVQDDTPSQIQPGQQFFYRLSDRIDSSIPPTDDDGTDSDGYDTPPPTTDFDGISTPPPTDNDGTDSDGIDTEAVLAQPGQQQSQIQQQQLDPNTDNDGTDSDGIATSQLTDNDGTDSDGIATSQLTDYDGTDSDGIATSQLTDNAGTDSDGIDTTGNLPDTPPSPNTPPDSPDTVDTDVST